MRKESETHYKVYGELRNLPFVENVKMKLMEYGDFRSLYIEFPHFNSFGDPL